MRCGAAMVICLLFPAAANRRALMPHATFFAHSRMSIQHASVRSATASVEGLCWRWRAPGRICAAW